MEVSDAEVKRFLQDSSISSSSAKDESHYGKDWWFNFMNPSRIEMKKVIL